MPITDETKANAMRAYVIDRMSKEYPEWTFDQWLAMDVFDLSLSDEEQFDLYIREFRLEFDL